MRHLLSYTVITYVILCNCAPVQARTLGHQPQIGLVTFNHVIYPTYLQGRGEFSMFVIGLTDLGYKPGESITLMCRSGEVITIDWVPRRTSFSKRRSM